MDATEILFGFAALSFVKQTLLVDEFFGEQTDDGFILFSRR
jgi:hypothetical protein